jgi:hypothetical protein
MIVATGTSKLYGRGEHIIFDIGGDTVTNFDDIDFAVSIWQDVNNPAFCKNKSELTKLADNSYEVAVTPAETKEMALGTYTLDVYNKETGRKIFRVKKFIVLEDSNFPNED